MTAYRCELSSLCDVFFLSQPRTCRQLNPKTLVCLRRVDLIHSARYPAKVRLVPVCLSILEYHHSVNRNASATANVPVTWHASAKNVKTHVLERVAQTPNAV